MATHENINRRKFLALSFSAGAALALSACGQKLDFSDRSGEQQPAATQPTNTTEATTTTTEQQVEEFTPSIPYQNLPTAEIVQAHYENLAAYYTSGNDDYLDFYLAPESTSPQLASYREGIEPIKDYVQQQRESNDSAYAYSFSTAVTDEFTTNDGVINATVDVTEFYGDGSQSSFVENVILHHYAQTEIDSVPTDSPVMLVTERYVLERPE